MKIILLLILIYNLLLSDINFTDTEKKYIESNTFTYGMTTGFYPFSFKENGKIDGYAYDYINLIIKKSGLKINIEQANSWNETLNKFKTKKIDLIDGISYKKDREPFTNFSQHIMKCLICYLVEKMN